MTLAPGLDEITHEFGLYPTVYPNEFDLSGLAFSRVFELYVTDGVSARWDQGQWEQIIGAIMSCDTTCTTNDVFSRVWGYFVRDGVDADPRYAGVQFAIGSTTYTKIRIRLYDYADVPDTCSAYYGSVCKKYSFYTPGTNTITVNASPPYMSMNEVLGLGIAHELQHLCHALNGASGFPDENETLSTLAEYFMDSWRPRAYDLSYGAGVARPENCEPWIRYDTEKCWIIYLYEAFKGDPGDPTDDLVYRWVHSNLGGGTRLWFTGLATVLWGQSDYAWLGGSDSRERFAQFGANYLAAKFCNAPAHGAHGEFGSGGMNTVRDLALFLDNCTSYDGAATPMSPVDCPSNLDPSRFENPPPLYPPGHNGCWNVRVLVPDYELGQGNENLVTGVSGIYTDGDDGRTTPAPDGSMDYIDVKNMGTDYVIFRAGPYFEDGNDHALHIRLRGTMGEPVDSMFVWQYPITPVGWVIGYNSNEDTLQLHPEAIQFIRPLEFGPKTVSTDWTVASASVCDFGRSIKAVVLAVGAMPYGVNTFNGSNSLVYEYSYCVCGYCATLEAFSRQDGTLRAQPDTASAGCPRGDGDDVVVAIAIDPEGFSTSIPAASFSVTVPDSLALYATAQADSDATLIDGKYRTTITLSKFGSCGAGPLTVLLNGECVGTVDVDMRSVDVDTEHSPGAVGISDFTVFASSYQSPPKPYNRCVDYRNEGGISAADWAFFGGHYNHSASDSVSGGSAAVAATAAAQGTLRLDLVEENPLVGERRLFAMVSAENLEPFRALVVSLRSDHPRLRFLGWEPDPAYPSTTLGAQVTRDGVRQAFVGVLGDGRAMSPVAEFGRVEFEVLGEEPLVLSEQDLNFIIADLEVVGGGLRSFSPIRLERNEVQPTYRFELAQNVPNPFNPHTTIAYSLASDAEVRLEIFDVRGARVKSLINGHETTGVHRVRWDGTNDRGSRVSSGIYFYRLIAGSFKSTRKMVLLR